MLLLLSAIALAQEPPPAEPAPEEPAETAVEATSPFHQIAQRWSYKPYWDPVGSASLYGGSGNQILAWNLGLQGGLNYWDSETLLAGRTRAQVMGTFIGGLAGTDLRIGSFMGPQEKMWSLMSGLDVFRNGFTSSRVALPFSWGVELPVVFTFGPPEVAFLAGVSTAWLAEPSRRVNWEESPDFGFGHEFGWRAGVALSVGGLNVSGFYSKRSTTRGPVQGFGFNIGL